jgi:hypothetical protein
VDLVKTKDGPGSDKKTFGPGPEKNKKFRPGPEPGSGHARSSLSLSLIDGHREGKMYWKLKTLEVERHIRRNHGYSWYKYILTHCAACKDGCFDNMRHQTFQSCWTNIFISLISHLSELGKELIRHHCELGKRLIYTWFSLWYIRELSVFTTSVEFHPKSSPTFSVASTPSRASSCR